jgi:carbon-monoxide dehydrogenase medium subunit
MTQGFDYHAPASLAEAVVILGQLNGQGRVIAGGTDLLLKMKAGQLAPQAIVNIKHLPELREFNFNSHLALGALTTLEEIRRSPVVREHYPALAAAAASMASVQIRNLATVGGNLCNAAPSADLAPILLALDAVARLAGPDGERRVPLADFFTGPGRTVLAASELLVAVDLPAPAGRAVYLKRSPRRHMDIAVVGVGLAVTLHNGQCTSARVALGAVAPTPVRARMAEQRLEGRALTAEVIEGAAQAAAEEARPIDDVRGSAWYRRKMVAVLTRRGLTQLSAVDF